MVASMDLCFTGKTLFLEDVIGTVMRSDTAATVIGEVDRNTVYRQIMDSYWELGTQHTGLHYLKSCSQGDEVYRQQEGVGDKTLRSILRW
jgi:hypothetical protein